MKQVSSNEQHTQAFIDKVVYAVMSKNARVDGVSKQFGVAPDIVWKWIAEGVLSRNQTFYNEEERSIA
ncbi:MAG: hypothetical protein GF344_13670 [Chitinivibrionales bacterium]|nr:hypothetical protein [Chitinivibrionales bacterium]MBD3357776.1 hypothetical protein [Chitinivibrionales bacterium]